MRNSNFGYIIPIVLILLIGCTIPTIDPSVQQSTLIASEITFRDGSVVSKMVGSGVYTNPVGGIGNGSIRYTSSDLAVANVDSDTGTVTIVAPGTTVITANKAATEKYSAASGSYSFAVTLLDASSVTFADGPTVFRLVGSGTYINPVGGTGTGAITYSSSVSTIAIVDLNSGEVTPVSTGTTVITATKLATATHAAASNSYSFTVTPLTPSTIVFADGNTVSKKIYAATYTNVASGIGTGAITYVSSTQVTATVDINSGAVTIVAPGSTVITANKAATATHSAVSNSYTLTVTAYAIGNTGPSGIGKVFYVSGGGLHGLEAAPGYWNGVVFDPTATSKSASTVTGGTMTAIGTGYANTYSIMTGAEHPAAALCRAYAGGGMHDWFLPSKDELTQLYQQKSLVSSFVNDRYWSSSYSTSNNVWYTDFTNGYSSWIGNVYGGYVRPVRAF